MQKFTQAQQKKALEEATVAYQYYLETGYKKYETLAKIATVYDNIDKEVYEKVLDARAIQEYKDFYFGKY